MKTIYNTIKVACVGMMTMAMTSCLDFSPEAQMNDDTVWSSAANFQLFANQFYSYTHDIQSGDSYQYAVSDGPHSDTRSDLIAGANANVYSQGTNTVPQSDNNYKNLYQHIYYTNLLLKNAANFGNQSAIAVPVAEAKFFRAYCYFELVQLYGNAILLTEPVDMDSPAMNATRDDRGLVIDQCVKDLQEAAEGLPETPSEAGRLCKDAAMHSFLVSLFMREHGRNSIPMAIRQLPIQSVLLSCLKLPRQQLRLLLKGDITNSFTVKSWVQKAIVICLSWRTRSVILRA